MNSRRNFDLISASPKRRVKSHSKWIFVGFCLFIICFFWAGNVFASYYWRSTELQSSAKRLIPTVIVDVEAMTMPSLGMANCTIAAGTPAIILDEYDVRLRGVHVKVNANGCRGWISKAAIADRPEPDVPLPTPTQVPMPSVVKIQASNGKTWLYTQPDILGDYACSVNAGDVVNLLERQNSYFQVSVDGKCTGWLFEDFLTCHPHCRITP